MTKLAAILDQIDSSRVLPSEFQRAYVWKRDQVRGLMSDLYRGRPVGSLLTWETQADGSVTRLAAATTPTRRALILNNQQRVASLNARLVTPRIVAYMERLSRLRGVLDRMPEDKITGEDKAVHVTAEISGACMTRTFNRQTQPPSLCDICDGRDLARP